jgi:hypothetical protein
MHKKISHTVYWAQEYRSKIIPKPRKAATIVAKIHAVAIP